MPLVSTSEESGSELVLVFLADSVCYALNHPLQNGILKNLLRRIMKAL